MNFSLPFPKTSQAQSGGETLELSSATTGLPRYLRFAIVSIILSLTVFGRMGVNVGEYTVSFGLLIVYGLLAKAVLDGEMQIDAIGLLLFGFAGSVAAASFLFNNNLSESHFVSLSSLMLLIAMYFPFMFVLKQKRHSRENWLWLMKVFSNIALACAIAGIAQFYLQFVIHKAWLFNISLLLPPALSDQGIYNSAIPVGSLYKANGIVFREPSFFSYTMAFSIICELALFKRYRRVAVLGFGLLLSYSGTGILALAIGMMFPLGFKTLMRIGVIAVAGMVIFLLFGDALNLSFTLSRVGEFGAESSSGYIRYVAPMRLIGELIDSSPWTAFVGHGPGTIYHAGRTYEFHDPTWAKLLYEYGLLGFTGFLALILLTISHSKAPIQIRAVMFFSWLIMGGHLLTPENVLMMFTLLAIWPRPADSSTGTPSEEATTLTGDSTLFAPTQAISPYR